MKLRGILESAMRPAIIGWLGFILFSSAFIGSYLFISYQYYLKTYQANQIQEIKTVRQKTVGALKHLQDLLELAEPLISATLSNTTVVI